jgi:hypothetical protein
MRAKSSLLNPTGLALATALASILAASSPAAHAAGRSKVFEADFEHTWTATLSTLQAGNMPLSTADKSSGLLLARAEFTPSNANEWVSRYTTQHVRALSGWTNVQLGMSVTVIRHGNQVTEVKVEPDIAAYNGWTEIWRRMDSSGNIEEETFASIQNRLSLTKTSDAPPAAAAIGTVKLASKPAGADIEVDGSFVGQSPAELSLTPGKHTIKVSKKDFAAWSRDMEVLPGAATSLEASLEKK